MMTGQLREILLISAWIPGEAVGLEHAVAYALGDEVKGLNRENWDRMDKNSPDILLHFAKTEYNSPSPVTEIQLDFQIFFQPNYRVVIAHKFCDCT
jgi:hypothetical protein